MPIISEVNQQSVVSFKRYFDQLHPLKKWVFPRGVRDSLNRIDPSAENSFVHIKFLIDAVERSSVIYRRRSPAFFAFFESPLLKACRIGSEHYRPISFTPLSFILKSNDPESVAKVLLCLRRLKVSNSVHFELAADHKDPLFLAKALDILLRMRPLDEEKKTLFLETIVKSNAPLAVAKILNDDSKGFYYGGSDYSSEIMAVNREMLAQSRSRSLFSEALRYLEENQPSFFSGELAEKSIRVLGMHEEPLKAAMLLVYLCSEKLLTGESGISNLKRVAESKNPLALLRGLGVSMMDVIVPFGYGLKRHTGSNIRPILLQANFEALSQSETPEALGFALSSSTQSRAEREACGGLGEAKPHGFFSQRPPFRGPSARRGSLLDASFESPRLGV